MAVLEKTVRMHGRTPEEVFAFCLDGANFPGFLLPAQVLQSCFVCSASARRPLDLHHATPALALFRTRGSRWCVACMGWPNPSNAT